MEKFSARLRVQTERSLYTTSINILPRSVVLLYGPPSRPATYIFTWLHNTQKVLRYDGCCMIETPSVNFGNLRLSSEIFNNLRIFSKYVGKSCLAFVQLSENLWKVFGNLQKIVKKSSIVCLYNKQKIHELVNNDARLILRRKLNWAT